jgi:hypothetical protein
MSPIKTTQIFYLPKKKQLKEKNIMTRFELLIEAARLTAKVKEVAAATTFYRIEKSIGARICDARMLAAAGDMKGAEAGIRDTETLLNVFPRILQKIRITGPIGADELKGFGCTTELFIEFLDELQIGYVRGRGPCAGMIFFR